MKKKLVMSCLFLTSLSIGVYAKTITVNKINVVGLNSEQQLTIKNLLSFKVGDKVTDDQLNSERKTLLLTKKFQSVDIHTSGNQVFVNVKLLPLIAYIDIKGSRLISKDQIFSTLEASNIYKGAPLNKEVVSKLMSELEKFYKSAGYDSILINPSYKVLEDGSVILTININENSKDSLHKVTFVGNDSFKGSKILGDSYIYPNSFLLDPFTTSKLNSETMSLLRENIEYFYKNKGYVNFTINDIELSRPNVKKPNKVDLKIDITEGDVFTFGEPSVLLDKFEYLEPEIKKITSIIKPGKKYNYSEVMATSNRIKRFLQTQGFYNPTIEVLDNLDYGKYTDSVLFHIDLNNIVKVRRIEIHGNNVSMDKTIRRYILQAENSTLNVNKLESSKIDLQRTGYYKQVNYSIQPIENSDLVDVIFNVEEVNTGSISAGIGYGGGAGFSFQAGLKQKNFLGTGNDVSFDLSKSSASLSASVGLVQPYFTNYGLNFSNNISYSVTNTRKYNGDKERSGYTNKSFSYGSSLGVPLSNNISLNIGANYTYSFINKLTPEYFRYQYLKSINQEPKSDNWIAKTNDISFNAGLNYVTVDSAYFPTEGIKAGINSTFVGPLSTNNYISTDISAKIYKSFTIVQSQFVTSLYTNYKHTAALGSKKTPFNNLYTLGGIGQVRGFAYDSIGVNGVFCSDDRSCYGKSVLNKFNTISSPIFGGNSAFVASAEISLPLFSALVANNMRLSLFFDAGTVWSTTWKDDIKYLDQNVRNKLTDYSSFGKLRTSTGISLQWLSPIAPLTFSYGIPLRSEKTDIRESFQFNIGYFY